MGREQGQGGKQVREERKKDENKVGRRIDRARGRPDVRQRTWQQTEH